MYFLTFFQKFPTIAKIIYDSSKMQGALDNRVDSFAGKFLLTYSPHGENSLGLAHFVITLG